MYLLFVSLSHKSLDLKKHFRDYRDIANVLDFMYQGSIRLWPKDVEGFRTVADWAQIPVLATARIPVYRATVRVAQVNGLSSK